MAITTVDRAWQELINRGIVRDPFVAGSLPPAFRQPVEGTPAPGEGSGTSVGPTLVVGLIEPPGLAPAGVFESEWTTELLEVWIRATKWPDAKATWYQIRRALTDKMGWTMAGVRVIQSREFNAFGLVDSSRAQGFTGRASITFETYAEDH